MSLVRSLRFVFRGISSRAAAASLAAALSLPSATLVGCKEPPPIPTTGSDVRRVLMLPDSEAKVRSLIELAKKSKEAYDLPTMRQTLVEASQSAQKLSDHVVAAELLTVISEMLVKEKWTRESERAITAARVAATELDVELSKKVSALTNLAVALHRADDKPTAEAMIIEADKIVGGVDAPEQRVPQMIALHAAWIKLGDPPKPDTLALPSEAQLKAARELLMLIDDPAKRTQAEYNSSSEAFRGGQAKLGREFYDAAVVSAGTISDPLVKAKTLVDLYEILHPFRNDLPIELPLQMAVDATVKIPSGSEKQALLKRIEGISKSVKPSPAAYLPTPTPTASATPTATPTATPIPSPTASATPILSATATPSGTPQPTATPTASASATPTATAKP